MHNPFQKAKPITVNDPDFTAENNTYSEFICNFEIAAGDNGGRTLLRINADGEFAAWVNGTLVLTGQHSQYPDTCCVETGDLSSAVTGGTNRLAVLVYRQGRTSSAYLAGTPHLTFEVVKAGGDGRTLSVLAFSSPDTLSRKSPSYMSGEVPSVSGQLGYTFVYSGASGGISALIATGFDPEKHGFMPSALSPYEPAAYVGRTIEHLKITEAKPGTVTAQGLFDLGDEYRTSYSQTHAYYMQNGALRSKFFYELSQDGNRCREIGPAANYLAEEDGLLLGNPPAEKKYRPVHFRSEEIGSKESFRTGEGIYAVIDLGEETFGYVSFDLEVPEDTVCGLAYSDHLLDLRTRAFVGGRNFSATLLLRKGRNRHTHLMQKIGARYLMIFAETDDLLIHTLGILPVDYPIAPERAGAFRINDGLHRRICEISLRTLKLCMNEHYMDCPQREQSLYAMDSRNQMLCGYYAFGEYAYAKESILLMAKSQRADGLLELCSPAKVSITIPSFSVHWVIALCEYVQYSGDTEFFTEMLPTANAIMRAMLDHRTENGCLKRWEGAEYWNFHEWSGELAGTLGSGNTEDTDACLTGLFLLATEMMADRFREISVGQDQYSARADSLQALAGTVQSGFNETFFDPQAGMYASYEAMGCLRDYSQFTNALAILSGAAALNEKYLKGAVSALLNTNPLRRAADCTLSTTLFKYEALLSVSPDYIVPVMAEIEALWGKMLGNGATTFWETIVGAADFDDAGSLCHGWSAIPVVIYYKYLLGIRPTKPGFRAYEVNPYFYDGHNLEGSVFLPKGSGAKRLRVEVTGKSFVADEQA